MKEYITVKELAEKWNMTPRNVQNLCAGGKIEGVVKFGNVWAIPKDAEKPEDKRVVTGIYRNSKRKSTDK